MRAIRTSSIPSRAIRLHRRVEHPCPARSPPNSTRLDMTLTSPHRHADRPDSSSQARARAFVDEVLIPLEEKAERAGGRLPDEDVERDPPRGAGARARRRPARRRAWRPGLDPRRVVPGRGAVRPLDQRAVLARPGRVQRARARHPGADRPLPAAGAARRAPRRLRGHRGVRRLGPVGIATTAERTDAGWRLAARSGS